MLDLALIRAEPARVKAALSRRGVGHEAVDAVTELDGRWTARREVREALRIRRRQISDEVARRKASLRTGPDGNLCWPNLALTWYVPSEMAART